ADELERIVNLVGPEALSASQRWVLETSGLIKEAVLQQSALDAIDSYCSPQKQFRLLDLVLSYHLDGTELINLGVPVESLTELPYGAELRRLKSAVSNDDLQPLDDFASRVRESFDAIRAEYSVNQGSRS
ncbi:MAG: V-type ATP synthase subunit A, partial [Gammaproteobacteria bacterium]